MPCLKFAGVIVTAFVPPVDEFKIVLICPSVEAAANDVGAVFEVASTKVIAVVRLAA